MKSFTGNCFGQNKKGTVFIAPFKVCVIKKFV